MLEPKCISVQKFEEFLVKNTKIRSEYCLIMINTLNVLKYYRNKSGEGNF